MIWLIFVKIIHISQILQGVPKLSHATVYIYIYNVFPHIPQHFAGTFMTLNEK